MRIELQLNVSQSAFFDALTKLVVQDIKISTGRTVGVSQLAQFHYKKKVSTKLGAQHNCNVVIQTCQFPSMYQAMTSSAQGDNLFGYQVDAISDQECHVVYTESFESDTYFNRLNYNVLSLFYHSSSKKRMISMIRAMEEKIKREELA